MFSEELWNSVGELREQMKEFEKEIIWIIWIIIWKREKREMLILT